jgi:formamidopyrimidine-DNA glycosylase
MPELPEVEVTRLGVAPHIEGKKLRDVILRRAGLRWPFPVGLREKLLDQRLISTARRGKYLLLHFSTGTVLIHLGMSGHLRILPADTPAQKHDHADLLFGDLALRMTDPRRFGALLWHDKEDGPVEEHLLLRALGVEPLEVQFDAKLLYQQTRLRSAAIKQVLLAGDVVVGVGNIYASESLFRARINPKIAANRISLKRYEGLVIAIKQVLAEAISKGGSSLKDFIGVDGQSGYFQQSYFVYDRAGEPCKICQGTIRHIKQGQRSSFYCVNCQK